MVRVVVAILGLASVAFAWAMAVFVLRARPDRTQNQRLAVVLFIHGILVAPWWGLSLLTRDPATARGLVLASLVAATIQGSYYLHFLGTLNTPWARPFRHAAGQALLLLVPSLLVAAILAAPERFVVATAPAHGGWEVEFGPWFLPLIHFVGGELLLALAITAAAWRSAPKGTAPRSQAKSFTLAFSTSDAFWTLFIFVLLPAYARKPSPAIAEVSTLAPIVVSFAYVALIGYGILRTQLFDIHVRLKHNLRRSLVVGAFALAFFAVSEGVEAVASRGGTLYGLLAAGHLAFGLRPLERAAGRVADRLMPSVDGSASYLHARRLKVYRGAIEGMYDDGDVTAKESAVLVGLRKQLGISDQEAAAIETSVREHLGAPRRAPSGISG